MASSTCSIYGLFITNIISLCLGIGTLIVNIVLKYVGFVESAMTVGLCGESYLSEKYKYLALQLGTGFVGICVGVGMGLAVLGLMIAAVKNLRASLSINPQLKHETLPSSILSKTKLAIIYILVSFGTLGTIVCFGYYLSLYFDTLKDPSACPFTYNDTNLLILVIISGVWLLSMLVQMGFMLVTSSYVVQNQEKEEKENKYKEMINVTEQPGVVNQYGYGTSNRQDENNLILKGMEFTQQPSNGQVHSFGNPRQFLNKTYNSKQPESSKENRKPQPYILKDMESSQVLKGVDTPTNFGGASSSNRQKDSFFNYNNNRQALRREPMDVNNNMINREEPQIRINTIESMNPQKYSSGAGKDVGEKKVISRVLPSDSEGQNSSPSNTNNQNYPVNSNLNNNNLHDNMRFATNTNQYNSAKSSQKSPGKFYNSTNNQYIPSNSYPNEPKQQSIRNNKFYNQPEYNNPFSKPLSPIKQLNESVIEPNNYSPMREPDPFKNVEMFGSSSRPQQRVLNTAQGKDYRPGNQLDEEQDTKGKLVFYKKAIEENKFNQRPDSYRNDIQRFDKHSSGEVSFKSPSRFDSKFAQEENRYLSRNTVNSILPALNKIKDPEGSRKNALDDKYSSGGMGSYFGQSRGRESSSSPTQKVSRTKAREGVLTSFIRGKFA